MLRKLLAGAVLAVSLAAPAAAQPVELLPGVFYERQVQFTSHGPVVIHVLAAPKPGGLYALRPVLSNGTILGTETVSSMQKEVSAASTVAGVNGDLFTPADGHPDGVLMRSGVLEHPPLAGRSSIGIGADGSLHVDRVAFFAYWQGTGQRHPFSGLNDPPGAAALTGVPASKDATLYTPAWGPATPSAPSTVQAVVAPFPAATPNTNLTGPVAEVARGGNTPIPPNGAVLVASGSQAGALASEAAVGTTVTVRLTLNPDWTGTTEALGGGPVLVRDGKPVFRADELFTPDQLVPRGPRTAVGQLTDGGIVLVAVDGSQRGYSAGMTNFELAQTLVRLGAVTGAALDSGGSTAMAFDGTLLNRPANAGGERAVSDALLVFYTGVYAPRPSEPVLSPNGDGVAEQQQLAYKVVRPSTVTASLVGPDGVPRTLDSGAKQPGVYPFSWNGMKADGSGPELEGTWHWLVSAVDDQGQSSTIDRSFSLNDTLGYLAAPALLPLPPGGASLTATCRLARAAEVTVSIESAAGAPVRTLPSASFQPGQVTIRWDGRTQNGTFAHTGRYVLRVSAVNTLGRVDLTRPLSVRRVGAR